MISSSYHSKNNSFEEITKQVLELFLNIDLLLKELDICQNFSSSLENKMIFIYDSIDKIFNHYYSDSDTKDTSFQLNTEKQRESLINKRQT